MLGSNSLQSNLFFIASKIPPPLLCRLEHRSTLNILKLVRPNSVSLMELFNQVSVKNNKSQFKLETELRKKFSLVLRPLTFW